MILNGNGKSYPQVEMTINQMNFKNSRLESKNALGIWKAGMPGEISFSAGQSLRPFQVVSVFKIAVVVVSKHFWYQVRYSDARWPRFSI
jgi:hypothetical protein